jgi:hypothetical protein
VVRTVGFDPASIFVPRLDINWIALSDNYLFLVVNWNGVFRMPKYGGPIDIIDGDRRAEFDFALTSGKRVYWNHDTFGPGDSPDNRIEGRDIAGGASNTLLEGFGQFNTNVVPAFQIDDRYLYYFEAPPTQGLPPVTLKRLPLAGGKPEVLIPSGEASSNGMPGVDFLADGGDVFVVGGEELDIFPAGATTAKKLADLPSTLTLACADVNSVYLTDLTSIYRVPRSGGIVSTLYTTPKDHMLYNFGGTRPLVDANSVYFAQMDNNGWTIMALPKQGGTAQKISRTDDPAFNLGIDQVLQDDKNLFFVHHGGEVLMLPKTPTGPLS